MKISNYYENCFPFIQDHFGQKITFKTMKPLNEIMLLGETGIQADPILSMIMIVLSKILSPVVPDRAYIDQMDMSL
jgi:hypothetical protein